MPIIDGYDDLEVGGFSHWKAGSHEVTIDSAKLVDGQRQDGAKWYALQVEFTRTDGATRSQRIYYPASTAEWMSMKEGQRKATKSQLEGLGIAMSELESEHARAALIGKTLSLEVKVNGDYTNYYFQQNNGQDARSLPEPAQIASEGMASAAVVQPTTVVV